MTNDRRDSTLTEQQIEGLTPQQLGKEMTDRVTSNAQDKLKQDIQNERMRLFNAEVVKRNNDFQMELSKFVNKHTRTDDKGNVVGGPWESSDDAARKGLDSETTAFNSEWKNAMLSLLGSYAKLSEALNFTLEQNVKMPIAHQIKSKIYESFNKPSDQVEPKELGKVAIKPLMHTVSLDEEGSLKVDLKQDDIEMPKQFAQIFTGLVKGWLAENGYTAGKTPETKNKFYDGDGIMLTQEKLEELRDGDHTLKSYLENTASPLSFQSEPPRPM